MITIIYMVNGDSNADAKSESIAMNMYDMYKDYDYTHLSSTESLFTAFRTLIAEGKIPHDKVVFKYNDEIMTIDSDGQLDRGYPRGFCDSEQDLMRRLIKVRVEKMRAEKNKE